MNDNLYICPQYLKCNRRTCAHAVLHKSISIKMGGFDRDCNLWISRGICDFDPEQKVIKCIDSNAELLAEYERNFK